MITRATSTNIMAAAPIILATCSTFARSPVLIMPWPSLLGETDQGSPWPDCPAADVSEPGSRDRRAV